MAFLKGIFGRFSGIFCPWMSYRSHILTQDFFLLKMWSLELYQETSYEIFIFDHIWGGRPAYENLRQEAFAPGAVHRSSALCLFFFFFKSPHEEGLNNMF